MFKKFQKVRKPSKLDRAKDRAPEAGLLVAGLAAAYGVLRATRRNP